MSSSYEWDEAKRETNLQKHGIDFVEISHFLWEESVIIVDQRRDYGELRFISYGPVKGRLMVLVFARRGSIIRVISLRRANAREYNAYVSAIKD